MADYYLDEYLKKYATGRRVEYIKFMKLKASFLRLKDINRDQKSNFQRLLKRQIVL